MARSAGLLLYDIDTEGTLRVLLVHPGGPYWARRDEGAWSIPKGEVEAGEDPRDVAVRELTEELGVAPPPGDDVALGEVRQAGGKRVVAWARRGWLDVETIESNTFELEWPPRSGRTATFPEVDRAAWLPVGEARTKLLAGQLPLLDRLVELLAAGPSDPDDVPSG